MTLDIILEEIISVKQSVIPKMKMQYNSKKEGCHGTGT